MNSLLQILDDGRLTDGQGRTVDSRNTVLIMTSNLGTEFVRAGGTLGFLQRVKRTKTARTREDPGGAQEHFPAEFLNRIDEIIMFSPSPWSNVFHRRPANEGDPDAHGKNMA